MLAGLSALPLALMTEAAIQVAKVLLGRVAAEREWRARASEG